MYILFSGDKYYPCGGWRDYRGNFDTMEAAVRAAANIKCDWWHVGVVGDVGIVADGEDPLYEV